MAEVVFAKERGKDQKESIQINLEEFIAIKGIKALGNQLTTEKVKQINLLEPIPFEAPEEIPAEELEVVDETEVEVDDEAAIEKEIEDDVEDKPKKPLNTDIKMEITNLTNPNDEDDFDSDLDENGQIKLF